MILEEVSRNVRMDGMGKPIDFSVDEEDFGFISSVLSDRLYSDKPTAVIREYCCNAIDSNKESQASRNVLITPPTVFEPVFKVRDFGRGMSHKEIIDIYIKFGKSTKRGSNEQIGTFGLGAKSGFAYSDSFNITSWYEGTCYTYTAQKNKTGRLQLFPIGQEKSDEPSGIEISIAVDSNDINDFNKKIARFCKYLDIKVDFASPFDVPKFETLYRDENFFIEKTIGYSYDRNCYVLMGNVLYPINLNQLKQEFCNFRNLFLFMKIGEVDVAPDREKLEYTEKTKDAINAKLMDVIKTLKKGIQEKIDALPTPNKVSDLLTEFNSSFSGAIHLEIAKFTYKGRKIVVDGENARVYERCSNGGRFRTRNYAINLSNLEEGILFVDADEDTSICQSRLAEGFFQKHGIAILKIIVSNKQSVKDRLMTDLWDQKMIIHDFKSIWAKVSRTGQKRAPRIDTYVWKNNENSRRWDRKRLIDVKENKIFVLNTGRDFSLVDEKDRPYLAAARNLGIEFYGINRLRVNELDATWKPLQEVVRKEVEKRLAAIDMQKFLVCTELRNIEHYSYIEDLVELAASSMKNDDSVVATLVKSLKKIENHHASSVISIAKLIDPDRKDDVLEDEYKQKLDKVRAFAKKYEFLLRVLRHCGWHKDEFKKDFKKYIEDMN